MSNEEFVNDLRFADTTGKAVTVTRYSDPTPRLVGVHEVNEDEGWVSFFTPEVQGDETTRTRVGLDDLASVRVETEIDW